MKKSFIYIAFLGASVCLNSCLDYDNPGSELTTGQTTTNGSNQGELDPDQHINHLNYKRDITIDQANAAYDELNNSGYFGYSTSAQYCLRGGKNNGTPESHAYQYTNSLAIDNYAGYFVVTHYDFPYSNASLTSTYDMHETFNGGAHGNYNNVKNILLDFMTQKELNDLPEIKAVNLIYYSLAAQENTDISGPFTYNEDKLKLENPSTYNTGQDIYDSIVADLDSAVACLKYAQQYRTSEYKDILYKQFCQYQTVSIEANTDADNFMESCIELANSVKLRMAMHIVKYDKEKNLGKAKKWAEDAVKSGVCKTVKMQQALYPAISGFTNPLVEICNSWNDNRLGASFEAILKTLNHPYVKGMVVNGEWRPYLWQKNAYAIINSHNQTRTEADSMIVGIRAGAFVGEGQSVANNPYIAASTFNQDVMSNAPLYLVKCAEVDFLCAEGALRGWDMGMGAGVGAQSFYEDGIRNAYLNEPSDFEWYEMFETPEYDYSQYMTDYMAQEKPAPYTQVDPFGDGDKLTCGVSVGVAWGASGSDKETLLEQIITQKYIALFPNSWEAWTELRRTGYPRIFSVMNPEDGDGSLIYGDLIRRMPWAATDTQTKANIQATGLKALGGEDLQSTRLWWDIEGSNF